MTENKLYPDVLILWSDPTSIDDWHPAAEITEPNIIRTVGQLVGETETAYKVALNVDAAEDHCSCSMVIPKSVVILFTKVALYAGQK